MNPSSTASRKLPGIDAILVIHAKPLADRRASIERQFERLGLDFEFVLDYDIPEIPPALRKRLVRTTELSPAQESCALKHWRAHAIAVERGLARTLVLEDDVILADDFVPVFTAAMREEALLPQPHVTFLGCGGHYYVPSDEVRPGQLLYRRNQGKFADSYVLPLETARLRLSTLEAHGIRGPVDHTLENIDRVVGIGMYWLEPPIVEQGSHNGLFGSELVKSHPLWFQALQFRWKKLWRRRRHGNNKNA